MLLRLHRWMGLTIGLLVAAIALSGSATVAIADVERWVGLHGTPGDGRAPFAADQAAIAEAFPGAVSDNLFPADAPGRPDRVEVVVRTADAKEEFAVFCDPATGRVIGDTRGSRLVGFLRAVGAFHGNLFLPGPVGSTLLGVSGLALLLFAASGLWLWRGASGGGRLLVWHRLTGAVVLPVLVASAATGVLFSWQWARPLAYRALGGDPAALPYFAMTDEQRAAFRGSGEGTPLDIDAIVAAARAQPVAAGTGQVLRITSLASKAAKPVKVAFDFPGNGDHRAGGVVVQVDRITGKPAFIDDPRGRSPGGWLLSRQWSFHAGRWGSSASFGGTVARIAWILGGLGIAGLAVSGAALRLRRRPRAA